MWEGSPRKGAVRTPRETQKAGDAQGQSQSETGGQRQRWRQRDKGRTGEPGAAGPRGEGARGRRHVCGTTDLQMQRLLYREAASGLPGQHFPPQPRTQARNKTSRFHRTSHRKSLWGRPRPPFPHDWLGAAANSRLTSAPGACEPELPADAGFPTPGRGAPPTLPAPTRTSAQSQSPEDDLQGRVVPWRALLPGVSPGSGLPRPGVSSSHGGTSLAD
ncbi:serine/threonine-protein kinase PAK 6-like isoform X3 [Phocoena sinus]|uniref:serine/threonine-protein kinase PAK 6-like isoform X3 n=1 Tax=Phocoena sinus TaxID=42100 RepID=UPI0013C4271B|nr:serine/threonine-protein kinase PAK 6-like isoform X3 [Phocoena sinus]